jgi:uncharacterized damage-inducible protein DinB
MEKEKQIHQEIVLEFRRRVITESIPRIKKCLNMVDESKVWYRQNEEVNSIGNLILHLVGNARQWIFSGLGNAPDKRIRNEEFIPNQNISKENLLSILNVLENDLEKFIAGPNLGLLTDIRKVQVFEETGVSILIHVIEHFSYHTGQITLLTKLFTGLPTNYYGNINLDINE